MLGVIAGRRSATVAIDINPYGPTATERRWLPILRRRLVRLGTFPVEAGDARAGCDRDKMHVVLWSRNGPFDQTIESRERSVVRWWRDAFLTNQDAIGKKLNA